VSLHIGLPLNVIPPASDANGGSNTSATAAALATAGARVLHVADNYYGTGVDHVMLRGPSTSQFKGVSWNKKCGKWQARSGGKSLGHHTTAGRCRLKPACASTGSGVPRLGFLTQRPCVIQCDLTTCYSVERVWFQRLTVKYDQLLSNFAFSFNLRHYTKEEAAAQAVDDFVKVGRRSLTL